MPGTRLSPAEIRALVESFDWLEWSRKLRPDYEQLFADLIISSGGRTAADLGLDEFTYDDPFLQRHVTRYVGERIVQLEGTSKQNVIDLVTRLFDAADAEANVQDLANTVMESVRETWSGYERWRALRIARTETAIAYNFGNIFAAHQAGVTHFEVLDGDDDEECAAVNGTIVDVEWALANPTAHPNCTRVFSPIVTNT